MGHDIPHFFRIGRVIDVWEDLVRTSHVDDGLGIVSSFWSVSLVDTVLPGIFTAEGLVSTSLQPLYIHV